MRGVEIVPVRELSDRWRRRLLAVVAGLALVVTAAAPGAPASAAGPGSVAGIVTDAGGTPLEGITVAVLANTGAVPVVGTDLTDANGAYQVDGVDADPYYRVRFSDESGEYATEYHRDSISPYGGMWVPVKADEVTTLGPTSLEPGSSISGRLTRAGGVPVSGGVVHLWWQLTPQSYLNVDDFFADNDGRWTIPGLRDASYVLLFYDPVTQAGEVWDDQPNIHSLTPVVVAGEDLTGLDAELGGFVTNQVAPTISGTPQVGQELVAAAGTWAPSGTTVTLRWVVGADTSPGDDPTGATYTPTAQDVGKTIRVQATGSYEAGWIPATAWSTATAPVTAAPAPAAPVATAPATPLPVPAPPAAVIVNERLPRIKGTLRVERTVRVTTGDWTPYPRNLTFAWYAGGTKVKGAIHRRLRLTDKLVGKRLVVRVTATAPGYEPLTVRTRRSDRVRR